VLRELKRNIRPAEPAPVKPKEKQERQTQQPEQKQERNYSQIDDHLILASAPLGPSLTPICCDLPVVSVTTDRRFV